MSTETKEAKAPSKVEKRLSIDILSFKDRALVTDGLYSHDRCKMRVKKSSKIAHTQGLGPHRSVTYPANQTQSQTRLDSESKTEFQESNLFQPLGGTTSVQDLTGTKSLSGKPNKRRRLANPPGHADQNDAIGAFQKDIMSKMTKLNEHIICMGSYQQNVTKIWNSTFEKISGNTGIDLSREKKDMETVNRDFSDNTEKVTQMLNQTLNFTKKPCGKFIDSGKTRNSGSNSRVIHRTVRKNESGNSLSRFAEKNSEANGELQSPRGQQTSDMVSVITPK